MFIKENQLIDILKKNKQYDIEEIYRIGKKFYNKFCFLLEANKTYTSKEIAEIAMNFSNSDRTKVEAYHIHKNKTFKFDYYNGVTVNERDKNPYNLLRYI